MLIVSDFRILKNTEYRTRTLSRGTHFRRPVFDAYQAISRLINCIKSYKSIYLSQQKLFKRILVVKFRSSGCDKLRTLQSITRHFLLSSTRIRRESVIITAVALFDNCPNGFDQKHYNPIANTVFCTIVKPLGFKKFLANNPKDQFLRGIISP